MPYSGVDDSGLPEHIASLPTDQRRAWVGAVNGVLADCEGEDCEGRAFAVANAAIKAMQEEAIPGIVTERLLGGEIKRVDAHTIGGYGVLFTSEDDTDLEQDFFTPETDFWEEHIPTKILLYDHAQGLHPDQIDDATLQIDESKSVLPSRYVLGHVTKRVKDKHGIWFEAVLDENEEWREHVMALVEQGRLNYSTDSIAHLVDRDKVPGKNAYWIKSWAVPAISLTHAAAEPRALVRAVKRANDRALAEAATPQPGELLAGTQTPIEGERPMRSTRKLERKARGFFDAHEDQILTSAVKSLFWKARAAKEEGEIVEEVAATGELDNVIQPVAAQLAGLVGCSEDEAAQWIRKLVAERMAPAADAAKQDESFDEELPDADKMGDFEDEDFAKMFGDEEYEDPTKMDEFGMDYEDPTKAGDEFDDEELKQLMDEEEVPFQTPALKAVDLDADLMFAHMEVADEMDGGLHRGAANYSTPGYATKRVNVNKGAQPKSQHGWMRAIKAHMHGDSGYLQQRRKHVYGAYAKQNGREWATKALGTTPDTAGGYLVPPEQASEIIGTLYDESILYSGNLVSRRNMASSELLIPRATSAITVGHIGENTQLSDADVTFGVETLRARKAYAMIRISREEIEDSDPDVEAFYTGEIGSAIAEFIDQMVLRGTGIAGQPTGLLNRTDVTKTALNAVATYANLVDAVSRVEQAKVKLGDNSVAWIMNPRDTALIRRLEDGAGNQIWTSDPLGMGATSVNPPRLLGYPVFTTNQLDIDSDNNNETEIFFGKWSDTVIGLRKAVEIQVTDQRYFDFDQIAIRAIVRYDVGMYRDESIEILTDVRAA